MEGVQRRIELRQGFALKMPKAEKQQPDSTPEVRACRAQVRIEVYPAIYGATRDGRFRMRMLLAGCGYHCVPPLFSLYDFEAFSAHHSLAEKSIWEPSFRRSVLYFWTRKSVSPRKS